MKKYKYIALAALALGLAACSQEDDFVPQGNQKNSPLAIASAGVAELATRANISSDNELVEGSIGVFVNSTTDDTRYTGSNLEWKYNEDWTMEGTTKVLYEADGTKQTIGAYYPYNATLAGDGTYLINLPETYESNYEDYDYLYADYTPLNANPVSIEMNHLLSKVSVSISYTGSEIAEDDGVTGISLTNVSRKASWNVPSSELTAVEDADQTVALYGDNDTYVGYVVPNGAKTIAISVTTNKGRTFRATASLDDKTTTDKEEVMTQGEHYKIGLRLGKDKVTVTNISIAEWEDTGVEGGTATECIDHTWTDGVCTHCELPCLHPGTTGGFCDECKLNIGYDYDAATDTWSVYDVAALELALEKGGTVMLAEDEITAKEISVTIESGTETTLDLNGKTLRSERTEAYDITIRGKLTIKDFAEKGEIHARINNSTGGKLVVESGYFSYIQNSASDAETTIKGGTVVNLYCVQGTIEVQGGKFTGYLEEYYGELTITGGTFSKDPSEYVPASYKTTNNGNGTYTVTANE